MKTYIINLERSIERKAYMKTQCEKLSFLDAEFVKAVDGRSMSMDEQACSFDKRGFKKRYSIEVRPGEIGCTLSHQKCYKKILEEDVPYVLILEDDILLPKDITKEMQVIEEVMDDAKDKPMIILLSGWYWYGKSYPLLEGYKLVNVFDAFLTHSYIINQAAAKLLIEERPFITADDWRYIRRKGVKLQAVLPHLIDQNWDGSLTTVVNVEPRTKRSFYWYCRNAYRLLYMKYLKAIGHFEKA